MPRTERPLKSKEEFNGGAGGGGGGWGSRGTKGRLRWHPALNQVRQVL